MRQLWYHRTAVNSQTKVLLMYKLATGVVLSLLLLLTAGCVSMPLDYPKEPSVAISDTSDTREAMEVRKWLGDRDDVNGCCKCNCC